MAGKKKTEVETPLPALDKDDPKSSGAAAMEGGEGEVHAEKPTRFGKKQKIIAAAVALVLLGGGGGAALFMGGGDKKAEAKAGEHEEAAAEEAEEAEAEGEGEGGELPLVDVPVMIVNLRTATGDARYLKLRFMIEARTAAKVEPLKAKLPAIIDAYQPFLRELRPEDLAGSGAVFRIKEEMLARATAAVGTGMVKDILIQDLVQQ